MDGVFISGTRPQTKKALKAAASTDPGAIAIESTSMFGGYSGPAMLAPEGQTFYIAGPDPYTSRKWYANIVRNGDSIKVA